MNNINATKNNISNGGFDEALVRVYGNENLENAKSRYLHLAELFEEKYTDGADIHFFSAPGRTEVCGNHTDHNHGQVLAAAINLDAVACASKTENNTIRVKSENYPEDLVDLSVLTPDTAEFGTSKGLIRGVAARFNELGYNIGGFDAVTVNSVLKGSGLSSSASAAILSSIHVASTN